MRDRHGDATAEDVGGGGYDEEGFHWLPGDLARGTDDGRTGVVVEDRGGNLIKIRWDGEDDDRYVSAGRVVITAAPADA